MTNKSIEPFKPTDYVEAVRAKIRTAIFEAVPSEQWDAMIKVEIEAFMKPKVERHQYNGSEKTIPSGFSQLCQQILTEQVKARINTAMTKEGWDRVWDESGLGTSAKLEEFLHKHAGAVLNSWLGNVIQNIVEQIRNSRPR
jgi:hypothetical protein